MSDNNHHMMQEPQPDYEKAELDLLRDALRKTYAERFKMMTTLMKMNILFSKAKIIHKPFKNENR